MDYNIVAFPYGKVKMQKVQGIDIREVVIPLLFLPVLGRACHYRVAGIERRSFDEVLLHPRLHLNDELVPLAVLAPYVKIGIPSVSLSSDSFTLLIIEGFLHPPCV
jgi:hypothetical protein